MKNQRGETILQSGQLHDDRGHLIQTGYATSPVLEYDRSRIKAPKFRIKEWDYYLVNDGEYALCLTVGDLGYIGMVSASIVDFKEKSYKTTSVTPILPMGKMHMPQVSSEGVSRYENDKVSFTFTVSDGMRHLDVTYKGFDGDEDLTAEVVLDQEPRDSMVIATPWPENPKAFYYNQKIVGMRAMGSFTKGGLTHYFKPEDSLGLLDWGRGVWTYDNNWFWCVAQGHQNGHLFSMNLGYGFGDTSAASENMVFIDGICHKLGVLDFGIPEKPEGPSAKLVNDRYYLLAPWHFTDEEGRMDLIFTPFLDRKDIIDFKAVVTDQHQVYGTFDGYVVQDDGSRFEIRDLIGSAEVVHNRY